MVDTAPPSPADQHTYDAYCAQIEREDRLVNNRLSWLLTTEGLLFGALALIATSSSYNSVDHNLAKALKLCIPAVGIVIPLSVLCTNLFSHRVQSKLLQKWNEIEARFPDYPSPFGGQKLSIPIVGPSIVVPVSIIAAWAFLIWRQYFGR